MGTGFLGTTKYTKVNKTNFLSPQETRKGTRVQFRSRKGQALKLEPRLQSC